MSHSHDKVNLRHAAYGALKTIFGRAPPPNLWFASWYLKTNERNPVYSKAPTNCRRIFMRNLTFAAEGQSHVVKLILYNFGCWPVPWPAEYRYAIQPLDYCGHEKWNFSFLCQQPKTIFTHVNGYRFQIFYYQNMRNDLFNKIYIKLNSIIIQLYICTYKTQLLRSITINNEI